MNRLLTIALCYMQGALLIMALAALLQSRTGWFLVAFLAQTAALYFAIARETIEK